MRIEKLVMILVDELKGKKKEEIEVKLEEDIKALSKCDTPHQFSYPTLIQICPLFSDLGYIQKKLNEIGSQNALLLIFFKSFNEEKVKDCVDRLDNSLANFDVRFR